AAGENAGDIGAAPVVGWDIALTSRNARTVQNACRGLRSDFKRVVIQDQCQVVHALKSVRVCPVARQPARLGGLRSYFGQQTVDRGCAAGIVQRSGHALNFQTWSLGAPSLGCFGDSLVGTEDEQFPGSPRVLLCPGGESAGKLGLRKDWL